MDAKTQRIARTPPDWLPPLCLCKEKSWQLSNTVFSKGSTAPVGHGHCRGRLGKGVCLHTGRECVVRKVSKTRSLITKKLADSLARGEEVILDSRKRLCHCKWKLLRCPCEFSVLVKIYKRAIKDAEACCIALVVSIMHFMSVNTH